MASAVVFKELPPTIGSIIVATKHLARELSDLTSINTASVSKWVFFSKPIGFKTNRERLGESLSIFMCVVVGNQKNLMPTVTMKMFSLLLSMLLRSKVLPKTVPSSLLRTLLKPKL